MAEPVKTYNVPWSFLGPLLTGAAITLGAFAWLYPEGRWAAIVWLSLSLVGLGAGAHTVHEAVKDGRAVATKQLNGATRTYVQALLRRETIRVTSATSMVLAGVLALAYEPPRPRWATALILAALMYLNFGVTLNTFLDATLRRRMDLSLPQAKP